MSANNASLVDETLDTLMINSDSFFLIVMAILISLMQCGFGFLEAGAVRLGRVGSGVNGQTSAGL